MSNKVTSRNFVQAETAHRFRAQLGRAPVNAFHHDRVPVHEAHPGAVRPNVDVLYSHAVVDVSEAATFALEPSDEFQVDQVIDEQHYVVGVVYPGERLTLTRADLSSGTHVYVLGRTSLSGGRDRAHRLQDLRRVEALTANAYRPVDYDDASRRTVGTKLARRAGAAPDLSRAFGTPATTDAEQHLLGTRLGWGGLPPEHGQYHEGVATSSGCDIWTFDVPPVDSERGFYSVVKYDQRGRAGGGHTAIAGTEMMRNGDGTVSVYFGDDTCVATGNVIRTGPRERFRYAMRVYRPRDAEETRQYLARLDARGLETVLR